MSLKRRSRYWDVTFHVVDTPLKTEEYYKPKEILDEISKMLNMPAGLNIKSTRIKCIEPNKEFIKINISRKKEKQNGNS